MNATKLSRHYPALTSAERFSLMLAAAARGDTAEHARLVASAPEKRYAAPHTLGRALAFMTVCALHRMDVLNLAALYFKASAIDGAEGGKGSGKGGRVAGLFAYLYRVHEDGWRLFCGRENLDPKAFLAVLPGDTALEVASAEASEAAYTADEVRAYARRSGKPLDPKTAESVAGELGAIFRMWTERWE